MSYTIIYKYIVYVCVEEISLRKFTNISRIHNHIHMHMHTYRYIACSTIKRGEKYFTVFCSKHKTFTVIGSQGRSIVQLAKKERKKMLRLKTFFNPKLPEYAMYTFIQTLYYCCCKSTWCCCGRSLSILIKCLYIRSFLPHDLSLQYITINHRKHLILQISSNFN